MIKPGFIREHVEKSHREKRTTYFLRQLVFLIVDETLTKHYGADYSMRCLQSSAGIRSVLDSLGIKSDLFKGAVCIAQVYEEDETVSGWSGFWDKDHHVWVVTEFGELVDLAVAKHHLHPASSRPDGFQMPAIWWDDLTAWPYTIRYLPEGPIEIKLTPENMADFNKFTRKVMETKDRFLKELSVNEVSFEPLLYGPDSMNILYEQGNQWVRRTLMFQELQIPFPDWIQSREQELKDKYEKRN